VGGGWLHHAQQSVDQLWSLLQEIHQGAGLWAAKGEWGVGSKGGWVGGGCIMRDDGPLTDWAWSLQKELHEGAGSQEAGVVWGLYGCIMCNSLLINWGVCCRSSTRERACRSQILGGGWEAASYAIDY